MKKPFWRIAASCLMVMCCGGAGANPGDGIPVELKALVAAYAEHLALDGTNGVVWRDGARMPFGDGVVKRDFEDLLNRASLKDQMSQAYPAFDRSAGTPAGYFDPGRARHEPFFKKMYGSSEKEVAARLRTIQWLGPKGAKLRVTTVNGVDLLLEQVSKELEGMDPKYRKFLLPVGGGFNWRVISGTERLSPHSFGIAVDLNPAAGTYWQWGGKAQAMPWEIVEAFERRGFIWGGRWSHVDSFHFEYRPELILLGQRKQTVQGTD